MMSLGLNRLRFANLEFAGLVKSKRIELALLLEALSDFLLLDVSATLSIAESVENGSTSDVESFGVR